MSTSLPGAAYEHFDERQRDRLIELRRDLHRHPELSLEEERTAGRLSAALEAMAPATLERVAGTGVIARIRGKNPSAPLVAIRGDIDALPIQEATGLPFASCHDGVMHACGHDVHATWAVGAAELLSSDPAEGDVLVVLQPAEEIGEGAPAILRTGVLDHVKAIFGGHVDRNFEVGQVVAQAGPVGAAADAFEILVEGQGGHGARPHLCRDPIVAAAAMVSSLQTIVSRRADPASAAVVTVGSFQAGTAPNVIPGRAQLQGTLRSLNPETRALLQRELRHLAQSVGAAHHVEIAVRMLGGSPPVLNDPEVAEWARGAVATVLGQEALVPYGITNMGGEDFAFYQEAMPGCFLRIGAREPGGEVIGAHTPAFYAAEESIFVGASVLAEAARQASRALSV